MDENNYMKVKVHNLQSQLNIAIAQLEKERALIRELRSEKSSYALNKKDLEYFFLQCIDEVKKDIGKRREIQAKNVKFQTKSSRDKLDRPKSQPGEAEKLKNFQPADKKLVIDKLLENDNVLLFLYENLFPVTQLQSNNTQTLANVKNNLRN